MRLSITVDEKTTGHLKEIAKMHNCSLDTAAQIVLERYAERTRNQIESAHRAAKNAIKRYG